MPQTVSIHHRDATLPRTFLHHLVLPLPAAASPLLPPPPLPRRMATGRRVIMQRKRQKSGGELGTNGADKRRL